MTTSRFGLYGTLLAAAFSLAAFTSDARAATCAGTCGTLGADGVVTTSPEGGTYDYVTTSGGVGGAGQISGVGGTNGSQSTSSAFTASAGDTLEFYFNYVTSDGAGFADYGWAELVDSAMTHVAWLFTGRTTVVGDTSPGSGLPANDSTLTPTGSAIIGGGPAWTPLGGSSGACYSTGCGYTGWIKSEYLILAAGTFHLVFGVTNWVDTIFDTGLAFDGAKIEGVDIDPVPLPAALPLLLAGLGALGGLSLRRRKTA